MLTHKIQPQTRLLFTINELYIPSKLYTNAYQYAENELGEFIIADASILCSS